MCVVLQGRGAGQASCVLLCCADHFQAATLPSDPPGLPGRDAGPHQESGKAFTCDSAQCESGVVRLRGETFQLFGFISSIGKMYELCDEGMILK